MQKKCKFVAIATAWIGEMRQALPELRMFLSFNAKETTHVRSEQETIQSGCIFPR